MRLAMVLHHAGVAGVPAATLIEVAGFAGGADAGSQLARELRHMRNSGWQIDNIAPAGEDARYRMTSVDNRIRVRLTEAQQAALRRAVLLADRADLADRLGLPAGSAPADVDTALAAAPETDALETVLRAVREHRLLRFRYKGSARAVHPGSVRASNGAWHLRGREDGDDQVKVFVLSRMSEVSADAPDSATPVSTSGHPGLHPMKWEFDEPVEVTLRASMEFVPDVLRWLGEDPVSQTTYDDDVELRYRVVNRAGLRARLRQLGARVTLVGPADVRAEFLDELATMAGE